MIVVVINITDSTFVLLIITLLSSCLDNPGVKGCEEPFYVKNFGILLLPTILASFFVSLEGIRRSYFNKESGLWVGIIVTLIASLLLLNLFAG